MTAYVDTSAFLKLLVEEPGSKEAAAVWDVADRRVSSRLLYPEARAALAAARRADRLDARGLAQARTDLERLWAGVDCVELAAALAERAGDLSEEFALRGYDAVHLASAEAVADPDTLLLAADGRLLDAAAFLGLTIAPLG